MSYHLSLQVQITTDLEFLFPYMCNDGSSDLMTWVFKKKRCVKFAAAQSCRCTGECITNNFLHFLVLHQFQDQKSRCTIEIALVL